MSDIITVDNSTEISSNCNNTNNNNNNNNNIKNSSNISNDNNNRRVRYSKILRFLRKNRARVDPGILELPDSVFYNTGPRRTLRIIKPMLINPTFYDANKSTTERPSSINDNFYTKWSKRPHPSGNCRCSFRQSHRRSNKNDNSKKISQEIARIRTSLAEAEVNGIDIDDIEKTATININKLTSIDNSNDHQDIIVNHSSITDNDKEKNLESLEENVKKKIIKDLDRYINDLLDDILNDTIKALAEADNSLSIISHKNTSSYNDEEQINNNTNEYIPSFCPNISISSNDKGYVNEGYVGSQTDPDALDFDIKKDVDVVVVMENVDCVDSGINSVETVELQPEDEEHNLEKSLMDIIDEKLGGTTIGKSLEDLSKEIDKNESLKNDNNIQIPTIVIQDENGILKKNEISSLKQNSNKLDLQEDKIEEPSGPVEPRIEFKKNSKLRCKKTCNVGCRMNKTVSVIREKIALSLGKSRKKTEIPKTRNALSRKASLQLEDYRRRFPVPMNLNKPSNGSIENGEVLLRNRFRKPIIVFLHGFGSSAEAFGAQLKYFAELGYPCLAPDMLGHGLSSTPNRKKDYHFLKLLKDVEEVLVQYAFRPGQKCVIVAHNYGCSFAAAIATKYYSKIQQLVLISSGGPTPLAPPKTESFKDCCLRETLSPFLFCGLNRSLLYSATGRQHPYCGDENDNQRPSHMKFILNGMSWPESDYILFRRITIPTLLIHGLRDKKVSLVQECQLERTMPKAFLEALPTSGHMPMTDCPEQLNHMIHCFIDLWKDKK